MKVISEISLENFEFWSGAQSTAAELNGEQFAILEEALEDLHPEGMTDTEINDLFWFDSDWVLQTAGVYPKFYQLTSPCGLIRYVKAENQEEANTVECSGIEYEQVDETECWSGEVQDVGDFDFENFNDIHYFKVYSKSRQNTMIMRCEGEEAAQDFKEQFSMCDIEEIDKVENFGYSDEEDWNDWDGDSDGIEEFANDEDE